MAATLLFPLIAEALTCDVVVLVPSELQAHVVRAELLEFNGESKFFFRLVARNQDIGIHNGAAGFSLFFANHVQLVMLIRPRWLPLGANNVQSVSDRWVYNQALS